MDLNRWEKLGEKERARTYKNEEELKKYVVEFLEEIPEEEKRNISLHMFDSKDGWHSCGMYEVENNKIIDWISSVSKCNNIKFVHIICNECEKSANFILL